VEKRRYRLKNLLFGILVITATLLSTPRVAHAENEGALWNALRNGTAFAMMRHALAPGTGDPKTFVIGDCTTQRNLSDDGRDQSRRISDRFRANGIPAARVFTSQWCRCAETAELLGIGDVVHLPALNSFFTEMERRSSQTATLSKWIAEYQDKAPLVLVTHQVNITALTEVYPRSGEIVVARRDENGNIRVLGTIHVPARR
jgi:broad specificity phosphatase PhoE